MKKTVLTLCTLATISLVAYEDDWNLNNSFTIWGDVAFYRRSLTHKHRLIIDQGLGVKNICGVCNFDACDAKHLVKKFTYEPGFKVGMSYGTTHSLWEATYLWLSDWGHCCTRSDPGELYLSASHPDDFYDFSGADTAKACYTSWFQNAELNYFRYVTPHRGNWFGAAWMAGLRYIYLDEELELGYTKGADHSTYHVHVWNNIPTLQVGGTFAWNPTKRLSWDLIAKVGIGFDFDSQHTRLGNRNNTVVLRNYTTRGFATPVLADALLSLTYQPWRFLNIHTAYQMIYLNGVALAPDQLVKKRTHEHYLNANGMALIHGWTAGLAFSF